MKKAQEHATSHLFAASTLASSKIPAQNVFNNFLKAKCQINAHPSDCLAQHNRDC